MVTVITKKGVVNLPELTPELDKVMCFTSDWMRCMGWMMVSFIGLIPYMVFHSVWLMVFGAPMVIFCLGALANAFATYAYSFVVVWRWLLRGSKVYESASSVKWFMLCVNPVLIIAISIIIAAASNVFGIPKEATHIYSISMIIWSICIWSDYRPYARHNKEMKKLAKADIK